MVEVGETERDVPVTVPIPGLMDRLVALAVLQLSVERPPLSMVAGLALKLLMAGFVALRPVTVTESNCDPRLPLE